MTRWGPAGEPAGEQRANTRERLSLLRLTVMCQRGHGAMKHGPAGEPAGEPATTSSRGITEQ